MRTLWNTISFLAVVNLLALVMVFGWLWQSGRLSVDRVRDIRAMLSTTTSQAVALAHQRASEAEAARLEALIEQSRAHPPADSVTQAAAIALVHRQSREAQRRLEDERRMLATSLEQSVARMEAHAVAIEQERAESRNNRAAEMRKRSDEQFLRAVKHMEQVPAKQAKGMIETLVNNGNIDQSVAYLDAMNPRAAAKVLREFKSPEEIILATELLERLRQRGVNAPSTVPSSDDSRSAALNPAHAASASG